MVELVIEDGTGVEGANSYVSTDEIIAYASDRGFILVPGSPENDPGKVAIQAINAMDYLNLYRYRWKGEKTEGSNRLDWPRKYVYLNDIVAIPDNIIPQDIKDAQCRLCIEIANGIALLPSSGNDAFITREKIGPMETEYSEAVRLAAGSLPSMPAVDLLLDAYLNGGFSLKSVRV
jgi:hypothetical protein